MLLRVFDGNWGIVFFVFVFFCEMFFGNGLVCKWDIDVVVFWYLVVLFCFVCCCYRMIDYDVVMLLWCYECVLVCILYDVICVCGVWFDELCWWLFFFVLVLFVVCYCLCLCCGDWCCLNDLILIWYCVVDVFLGDFCYDIFCCLVIFLVEFFV